MENIDKCKLCGCTKYEPLYRAEDHFTQEKFNLVRCLNCTIIFTNPRPSQSELKLYYPPSYYGELGKRFHPAIEKFVNIFRIRLAYRIDAFFPNHGRILEIGSGRGTLLHEMANKGWTAIGTEYSENLADWVEDSIGVRVFPTPELKDCCFPDDHFDVVLCYHVLEHLPDPIGTLKEIHRIVQPNGLLVTAVPNIGGLTARLTKNHWFGIDVPRHLFHFTPESLKCALTQNGFKIISRSTLSLEQDVFGFSQSILNFLGFPNNIFYDLIRSPSGRMRHNFQYNRRILKLLQKSTLFFIGGFLSIIGVFVSVVASFFSMGGTLEYWATPHLPNDQ
jgi:SAM-dependent methyltransferase